MSNTVKGGDPLASALLGTPAWSGMAAVGYTNSWSDFGSGNVNGQYRKIPLSNEVEIIGTLSHVSITGNSAFFTMPAGYQPATAQLAAMAEASPSGSPVCIIVSTAGVLTVVGLPASSTSFQFHGTYSLDA